MSVRGPRARGAAAVGAVVVAAAAIWLAGYGVGHLAHGVLG